MIREQIQGPAGALHVDDGGTGGIPVVFIHSFAGSTAHWLAQLAHLRPGRRALALDLRGHGQSQAPANGDFGIHSLVDDVLAVMDGLDIERFTLVGHSLGGAVAVACAGAARDRVAALLLAGTPGKTPEDQAQQVLTAMEADYATVTAEYWNRLLKDAQPRVFETITREMRKMPRDAAMRIIRAIFEFDPLPVLRAYHGPVWIVTTPHGESPGALHRQLPAIPHLTVPGTSHWVQMDKPDTFNRLLDDFLSLVR